MIELTENLLYKLEEKMMSLLTDAEGLRQQVQRLQAENASLKQEKDNHTRKLQDLVGLLDSVNTSYEQAPAYNSGYDNAAYAAASKPVLVPALQDIAMSDDAKVG